MRLQGILAQIRGYSAGEWPEHYNREMVYEISITAEFSAAHQLRLYDGSLEPLHGHNWRVVVTVAANRLDEIGVVMDFHELERRLQHVVGRFHNQNLNDVIPFVELNPSAEKVAE